MADETYLFIDGKYLSEIHRDAIRLLFGDRDIPEIDFGQIKGQARAERVYFYDCLNDIRREGESGEDFDARRLRQETYFAGIQARYGFHVRLGTLTGKPRRLRQKEVDVQLAVDMLTHGLNRNMRKAVLIAGDLDFRPIVEALVRNGVFVEVWYEKRSASKDLFGAADFGRELSTNELYAFSDPAFTALNQLPAIYQTDQRRPQEENLRSGKAGSKFICLSRGGQRYRLFLPEWNGNPLTLEHRDPDLLERYFTNFYAPIEWK